MVKKMAKKAVKKTSKKTTKKVTKKAVKKVVKKTAKKLGQKATKKVAKKVAKVPAKKASTPAPKRSLKLGDVAPAFTLLNQDGKQVSLEEFRGKNVVVYFYPRAMTPGCTVQACGLRDVTAELAAQNIVVLGLSPDKPAALKKFRERDQLNFDLLSDPDHAVAKAYGSFGPKQFMGRSFEGILRQSFLLDSSGKLLHVMEKVNTGTHAQDVLAFYQSLK